MATRPTKISILSRQDIVTRCQSLITEICSESDNQVDIVTWSPPSTKRAILRATLEPSFRFRWWDDRCDVFNLFRDKFPTLATSLHDVALIEPPSSPLQLEDKADSEEVTLSGAALAMENITPKDQASVPTLPCESVLEDPEPQNRQMLPKFYYIPWPRQTHRLSFPQHESRKFPEDTATVLINYKARMQNDDSIELGLRITAHIHQRNTPLTIIPTTNVWHLLDKPHIPAITEESISSVVNVNDMRRAVCPYITINIGLSKGFCIMMLHNRHWYVIIVLEASNLIQQLITVLHHVSGQDGMNSNEVASIMKAYDEHVAKVRINDLALIAMDSLGYTLDEDGWESVRKYIFITLVQALSTAICTAPIQDKMLGIHAMHVEQQQIHFSCLSYKAVTVLLWPSRKFVQGPMQCNGRSCGAYGLASIWQLSSANGLDAMYTLIRERNSNRKDLTTKTSQSLKRRSRKRLRTQEVPIINFESFYDDKLVSDVIKEFDSFIRKQMIGHKND